jgi:site-specific recombinase XerD
MFVWLFKRKAAIQRHQSGPLLQERLKYLQYYKDNGATFKTLRRYANYLLIVARVLKLQNNRIVPISEITKAAQKLSNRSGYKNGLSKNARSFRYIAICWLEMLGRLKYPDKKNTIASELITKYADYMRLERGFTEGSISTYVSILKDFFKNIGESRSLQRLNILKIDKIIDAKFRVNGHTRHTIKSYCAAIRMFLRYAEEKKLCQNGLAESIKLPHIYKDESIPYGPSRDDVTKLLKSVESNHPTDIRDRAILMLLAIYGLRRGEVAKMRLDDLDWENEIICIKRLKNSKIQKFPLSPSVGKAIIRYLKEVRPHNCSYREVFIMLMAPYHPLSGKAISQVVSRRLKIINPALKHSGPHSLRHACATHLINKGISLKQISDYLGHVNLDSTRIYTKVDLINLRKVTADLDISDLI